MAIDFDGTGDFLSLATPVVTAYPFTIACWFNADNNTTNYGLFSIYDVAGASVANQHNVILLGASTDVVRWTAEEADVADSVDTTAAYTAGTWHHVCIVGRSATSRDIYLDGGNKGSTAIDIDPAGLATTVIGDGSNNANFAGLAAEFTAWDVALSDAQVAIAAKGIHPFLIEPQGIVSHVPAVRDPFNDLIRGEAWTTNGNPTVVVHPPKVGWMPWRIGGHTKVAAAAANLLTGPTESKLMTRLAA